MIEQNNWIDEIFASKWFLVENIAKVIRQTGYPEVYYGPSYLHRPKRTKDTGLPIFNAGLVRQATMAK
jgi:hypothetical protein